MNDRLKPNQEEKIIKNMVECIMDDLDNFYFDELIMKQYKKELFQFFKKISKEYSLFKAGFDFSNKKNIVNDKKKIEEAVKFINEIMRWHKTEEHPYGVQQKTFSRKQLEEIKNILEN
uniref:Uncharacterized protein n=1 Tax=uncultured marine thaumarchaeote KM3_173_E01 TaxID=1456050 RepID=A0A075GRP8_9ARCH|nr:hypothetical protein [uncultured marine thaumarchaeote KM3_173_E01]